MTYDGCEKRYVLSPKRERIGKSLGRNFKRAFAQHSSTLKLLDVLGTNHNHIVMDWVKELSKLTTTSHVRTISLRIGGKVLYIFISQGFITGLPTAQMFNDSFSSTYSSFGVDSLAENLYASTPPSSPSLSEYSFVGNISPITPEVSCVSSD